MNEQVLVTEQLPGCEDNRAEVWTLNRAHVRNALDPELVASLHAALRTGEANAVQVVVLKGAGASFCAGADLRFLARHDRARGQTPRQFLSDIWDLTLSMERSAIIFVAGLHGHAVAGGLELALACDIVLAEQGTLIGDGHVANNLLPGGGASARMERALGKSTAAWLALSGTFLDAQDPGLRGWLREVVEPGQGGVRAVQLASQLLEVPDRARASYKQLLQEVAGVPGAADKSRELDAFDQHWVDEDVPHAFRQFLTKTRKATA